MPRLTITDLTPDVALTVTALDNTGGTGTGTVTPLQTAPTDTGTISDLTVTEGVGGTRDASAAFSAFTASPGIDAFSISPTVSGVTINATTGLVTEDGTAALQTATVFTVTAENSGGAVTNTFALTVEPVPFDYFVNASTGSDVNDGSTGSPWQTLSKVRTTINALTAAEEVSIEITGDFTDEHLNFGSGGGAGAVANLTFVAGSSITWTLGTDQSGITLDSIVGGASGRELNVYGNGLTVSGFNVGGGNGIGVSGKSTARYYDVNVSDCVDALTGKNTAVLHAERCTLSDSSKAAASIVNDCVFTAVDCDFTAKAAATLGVIAQRGTVGATWTRCTFTPATAGQNFEPGVDDTYTDCVIGTYALRTTYARTTITANPPIFNSCFIHLGGDARYDGEFNECYGFVSLRLTNTIASSDLDFNNCVFGGGAVGLTDSLIWSNFDATGGNPIALVNCIVTGYADPAIGKDMTALRAQAFIDSPFVSNYTAFHGNAGAAFDTDIVADDGYAAAVTNTVTGTDPLLGSMADTAKANWAISGVSPLIGAGLAGSDIGFQA